MREIYLEALGAGGEPGNPLDNGLAITRFPCVIGRHKECDQVVDLPFISRRHCCFFVHEDQVWIQDLGSLNGTRLNGELVESARPVRDGDQLALGHLALKARLPVLFDAPAVLGVDLDAACVDGQLPGEPLAGKRSEEPAETVLLSRGGHRVLVVDDNDDAADSLAVLLRIWGHEVREAHDGQSALEAALDFRPTAVLLDLRLPGMDGYHVAQLLREAGLKNSLLVAVTGYSDETDRERAHQAGFDQLLTKPVHAQTLRELLTR